MLAPFLIMLREGLEAALIVGIIGSYLRQTGGGAWIPAIWVGVFLAVALSLFVGALLQFARAEFPQKAQEGLEAAIGLAAVVMLTSMVFWMKKAGRTIGAELRHSVDDALTGMRGGGSARAAWALIAMSFLAVAREGLESAFFLLAIFQQSPGPAAALSALAGVLVAVLAGFAFFHWGVRIDLRRFFRWTGLFILLVAAGLLAGVLRSLHEAGWWNLLQGRVYDMSDVLPASGVVGTVLSGLLNYQEAPTVGEALVWLAFLVVTGTLFLRADGRTQAGASVAVGHR